VLYSNEFVENNVFTCHTSIRPDYVGNIELSIFQTSTCSIASFNLFLQLPLNRKNSFTKIHVICVLGNIYLDIPVPICVVFKGRVIFK